MRKRVEQTCKDIEEMFKKIRDDRDRLRTLNKEMLEALRVANRYLLRDGDREIVQSAIAKAEKQIV